MLERIAECEKGFLAATETSGFEDILENARGIAVLSIVNKFGDRNESVDSLY